jgi:hypothetical protein
MPRVRPDGHPKRPRSAPHIARVVTRWPRSVLRDAKRGAAGASLAPPVRQVGRHSGGYNAPPPGHAGKKPSNTARGTLACPALRGDFACASKLTHAQGCGVRGTPAFRAPRFTARRACPICGEKIGVKWRTERRRTRRRIKKHGRSRTSVFLFRRDGLNGRTRNPEANPAYRSGVRLRAIARRRRA